MRTNVLRSERFHQGWLRFAAIAIGVFGPVFSLGSIETMSEPVRWSLDLLSWPLDGAQTYGDPTLAFLSALTGGFLLGWAVMIWHLAGSVYVTAPELIRKAVLRGFIAWFLLDSAGSIASGNASNALFNVLVLLTLVGPMWIPAHRAD